ncbi:MAG: protein kinase [Planctomycetota bacterium]|nr:protein kinase [Planctomycetota bacterium]
MNYYDADTMFGSTAVRLGLVDPQEAQLCAQLKQQSGGQYTLEQLLLQRGSLSMYNAQVIRQHLSQNQNGQSPQSHQQFGAPAHQNPAPQQSAPHFSQNQFRQAAPAPGPFSSGPSFQPAGPAPGISQSIPSNAPHFQAPSTNLGTSQGVGFQPAPGSSFSPGMPHGAHSPSSALISVASSPGSSQFHSPGTQENLYNSQSQELPKVGDIFGRYRIDDILGKGGMGIVFKAVHQDLSRTVALKMLMSGAATSTKQLKRFKREARAAARLNPGCIVPIHDVGELNGLHYFTMDYVQGDDLHTLLQKRNYTEKESLELIKHLAEALDYAHANDVIHRDLKPANILIDDTELPKITDFGIAKDVRDTDGETMSGEVLGTPSYMSPEQADGSSKKITGQADLFSLGTILYEMLYKDQAFKGATQYAVVTQVLTVQPDPPTIESQNVSAAAEAIVFKCLEKKPENRYATGRDLADDIQRVLRGKKPHAPILNRKSRRSKSNRWTLTIAGLVALLLPVLVWGFLYGTYRGDLANQEEIGKALSAEYKKVWDLAKQNEEKNRSNAEHYLSQAKTQIRDRDIEGALINAKNALELNPDTPIQVLAYVQIILDAFTYSGDTLPNADALRAETLLINEALLEDPAVSKQSHCKKVALLWLKKDGLATRKALLDALDKYPELTQSAFSFRYHGLLAEQDGSWRLAISEFKLLLKKQPSDHRIRARMARAMLKIDDTGGALRNARLAIKGYSVLPLAQFTKASVLFKNKDLEEALSAAKIAAKLPSEVKQDAIQLERVIQREIDKEAKKRRKNPVKPKPRVRPKPRVKPVPNPTDDKARHDQGHLMLRKITDLLKANRMKVAQRQIIKLEAFGMSCHDGCNALGVTQERMKRLPQASQSFQKAIKLSANLPVTVTYIYSANESYVQMQLGGFARSLAANRVAITGFAQLPQEKRSQARLKYITDTRDKVLVAIAKNMEILKKKRSFPMLLNEIGLTFNLMRRLGTPPAQFKGLECQCLIYQGDLLARSSKIDYKKRAIICWNRALSLGGIANPQLVQDRISALEKELKK